MISTNITEEALPATV